MDEDKGKDGTTNGRGNRETSRYAVGREDGQSEVARQAGRADGKFARESRE